jgi:hypothetical protein
MPHDPTKRAAVPLDLENTTQPWGQIRLTLSGREAINGCPVRGLAHIRARLLSLRLDAENVMRIPQSLLLLLALLALFATGLWGCGDSPKQPPKTDSSLVDTTLSDQSAAEPLPAVEPSTIEASTKEAAVDSAPVDSKVSTEGGGQ